jgi:hypothetical protein
VGSFTKGGQPARSATGKARLILSPGQQGERQMSRANVPGVERVILRTRSMKQRAAILMP